MKKYKVLAKKGLIKGYSDGIFAPNKTVKHGEIATILSNNWSQNNIFVSMEDSGYTHVDETIWDTGAIEIALEPIE